MKKNYTSKVQCTTMLLLIFTLLLCHSSNAQSLPFITKKNKTTISAKSSCKRLPMNPTKKFVGYIRDEVGEPMIGASVLLEDGKGTASDINGRYELEVPEGYQSFELTFSYLGYETKVLDFEKSELHNNVITDVSMMLGLNELAEVVIFGSNATSRGCTLYCSPVGYTDCIFSTLVKDDTNEKKDEVLPKVNVEIFPNPFVEQVSVKFNVPKEDNYQLQVFNAKGQLLWSESFSWYEGWHQEELNLHQLNLISGNYFLRIVGSEQHWTSKMIKID